MIYEKSVRTSQETRHTAATKISKLILFMEQSVFIVRNIRNKQVRSVVECKVLVCQTRRYI
jgi:hypothetical protein